MTRIRFAAVFFLIIGFLSGCGRFVETVSEPGGTPQAMAAEIINSQTDMPPLQSLTFGEPDFIDYLTQIYGILEEGLTDGVVCYAGGVEASEVTVLAFSDEDTARAAESALSDYIGNRADSFTGYVPEQAALVENSTAVLQGRYAALLICADPTAAQEAFLSCFEVGWEPETELGELSALAKTPEAEIPSDAPERLEPETAQKPETEQQPESPERPTADNTNDQPEDSSENEPETQPADEPVTVPEMPEPADPILPPEDTLNVPGLPDVSEEAVDNYDHAAVVSAWQNGNPSDLSDKNQAVYYAAENIISQVITDQMTPYQKELAIHDYLTAHCRYDSEANSNAPDASPDPDNENPYGMLVNGVGICRGYSSTFQLFMDFLNIECITVPGRSGEGEHAWNMVRLDGEWYCVDVTWDDPSGGTPGHRYFNVTSQFLRDNRHQWDAAGIPDASAVRWAYQND